MVLRTTKGIDSFYPKKKSPPLIVWEKWKDPYGSNIDEVEWPGYNETKDDKSYNDGYDDNPSDPNDLLELDQSIEQKDFSKPLRVIATPMGLVPLTEYTSPGKIFNFWVAHTTFSISDGVKNCVEKTDGVETLDIFTRYRMKIGIGKCFKPRDVLHKINTTVKNYLIKTKVIK